MPPVLIVVPSLIDGFLGLGNGSWFFLCEREILFPIVEAGMPLPQRIEARVPLSQSRGRDAPPTGVHPLYSHLVWVEVLVCLLYLSI